MLDDLIADLDGAARRRPDGSAATGRFFMVAGLHRWQELLAESDYGQPSEATTC